MINRPKTSLAAAIPHFSAILRGIGRRLFPGDKAELASVPAAAWAGLEAALFCLAGLAFGLWATPGDPFGVHAEFPWLWIVPSLLAMRYGTGIGITAVLILVLIWLLMTRLGFLGRNHFLDFPKSFFLGGLILILICGQFSDVWNARSRRLRAVNAYLDERLTTLTKNHFLLRLSHERLEQDLLAKPLTLRETLARLRTLTNEQVPPDAVNSLRGAGEFIQLLGQSCQLEIAAVYPLDRHKQPHTQAAAVLGTPSPLAIDDPLLQYCLTQNQLSHVQSGDAQLALRDASRYLICAPLRTSSGTTVGVLTVEKLPFFALNDDLLQLLSVLIGYYADGIQMSAIIQPVLLAAPQCPPEMALDIVRLHRIRLQSGIDTALVALVFENKEAADNVYELIKRLKRRMDLSWEVAGLTHHALITLLPLAGPAAVEGYLLRIESAVQTQFGGDFLSNHVTTHTAHLGSATPADTLEHLVERCAL